MFVKRELPRPGLARPLSVIVPTRGSVIRARVTTDVPELVSVHWSLTEGRTVPHLSVGCPECERAQPLEVRGMCYFGAVCHFRQSPEHVVPERCKWDDHRIVAIPEALCWRMCEGSEIGLSWRGIELDLWVSTLQTRGRVSCHYLSRLATAGWPAAPDVDYSLRHMWHGYLERAGALEPIIPHGREPGEEG